LKAEELGKRQAFPSPEVPHTFGNIEGIPGMNLRQYYAGLALQGLLACPYATGNAEAIALACAQAADALLAELAKYEVAS
jgi:hypothetical protein